jgi:ABC-type sugar transport system substrate-binding protein
MTPYHLVVVLLIILMIVGSSVFAQGSKEQAVAGDGVGAGKTIAFVPKQLGNPYFVAVKDAVEEASLANGFEFKANAPDSSIEVDKQIGIVEALIPQRSERKGIIMMGPLPSECRESKVRYPVPWGGKGGNASWVCFVKRNWIKW